MIDPTNNTPFGDTLAALGQINCTYAVYADGCEMYRSQVFSEALREFRRWAQALESALPNMGDCVEIKLLL